MAQRRMFSKTITNSSLFLRMPATSRLLYYDLGMNADDDGFCEHFSVMKMSGASDQDLSVLSVNGFVKVFDENVLVILHWNENNYIQKDRYSRSRYLDVYKMDTACIQNGYKMDTQVRLGKVRLGNNKKEIIKKKEGGVGETTKRGLRLPKEDELTQEDFQEIADKYQVPISFVLSEWDSVINYCHSKNKKYSDFKRTLMSFVKRNALKIRKEHNEKSLIGYVPV